jgi:gas vesicle protein
MKGRDEKELWTAIAIGAVVGIGATLLMRAHEEDDTSAIVDALKPVRKRARNAARSAGKVIRRGAHDVGEAGEEFLSTSRDVLSDLRDDASDIVSETRRELQKAAREAIKDARRAARKQFG